MKIMVLSDVSDSRVCERIESDFRTRVERLEADLFTSGTLEHSPLCFDCQNNLLVIITRRTYTQIMDWVMKIRAFSDVPILLMANNISLSDEYIIRNAGVDDVHGSIEYDKMLCLKIRAVQRWIGRFNSRNDGKDKGLRLHGDVMKIISPFQNGRRISQTEFKLLDLLLRNQGEIISRSEISRHVFRREWDPTDKSIDMLIYKVRGRFKECGDAKAPAIETVRGVGYVLKPA